MMTDTHRTAFATTDNAYRSCHALRDWHDEPGRPFVGRLTPARSRNRNLAVAFDRVLAVVLTTTIAVCSVVLTVSLSQLF